MQTPQWHLLTETSPSSVMVVEVCGDPLPNSNLFGSYPTRRIYTLGFINHSLIIQVVEEHQTNKDTVHCVGSTRRTEVKSCYPYGKPIWNNDDLCLIATFPHG